MNCWKWSAAVVGLMGAMCAAQTAPPASAPSTAPTTAPTKITFPTGFSRVEVGDHVAVCEAADEKWVREAMAAVKPATRPSTMPADVMARIEATRADISKQMAADALIDPKAIDEFYDKNLIPAEKREMNAQLHLVYLVTTKVHLADVMRDGFALPNMQFNRLTNEVSLSPNLAMTENEQAIPFLYAPESTEDSRKEALATQMRNMDGLTMSALGSDSALLVERFFTGFLAKEAILPLKLKIDQEWFGLGAIEWLGVKYAVQVVGVDRTTVLRQMTAQPARSPIKMNTIDLANPDVKDLKPEYRNAYSDAVRRRSLAVIAEWVKRDGEQVIPKVLAALKKNVPADGAGMLKMIKNVTGADLKADVAAQP